MAVAIAARPSRRAQANSTVVILGVSLLPLVTILTRAAKRAGTW